MDVNGERYVKKEMGSTVSQQKRKLQINYLNILQIPHDLVFYFSIFALSYFCGYCTHKKYLGLLVQNTLLKPEMYQTVPARK